MVMAKYRKAVEDPDVAEKDTCGLCGTPIYRWIYPSGRFDKWVHMNSMSEYCDVSRADPIR